MERVGLGCHMKDILTHFGLEELSCRLGALNGPHTEIFITGQIRGCQLLEGGTPATTNWVDGDLCGIV